MMRASLVLAAFVAAAGADVSVDVAVDARSPRSYKPFAHYWKRSFGSGHAALSLRPDWQDHLKRAVEDLGLGGVRYHGVCTPSRAIGGKSCAWLYGSLAFANVGSFSRSLSRVVCPGAPRLPAAHPAPHTPQGSSTTT